MNWQKLAALTALVVALSGGTVAGIGWAGQMLEHFDQVAANSQWIALSRFEQLSAIRKARKLTFEEWRTWCILGQQLGYWQKCPTR